MVFADLISTKSFFCSDQHSTNTMLGFLFYFKFKITLLFPHLSLELDSLISRTKGRLSSIISGYSASINHVAWNTTPSITPERFGLIQLQSVYSFTVWVSF